MAYEPNHNYTLEEHVANALLLLSRTDIAPAVLLEYDRLVLEDNVEVVLETQPELFDDVLQQAPFHVQSTPFVVEPNLQDLDMHIHSPPNEILTYSTQEEILSSIEVAPTSLLQYSCSVLEDNTEVVLETPSKLLLQQAPFHVQSFPSMVEPNLQDLDMHIHSSPNEILSYTIQKGTISIDTIPANTTLVDFIEEIPQPQSDTQGMSLTWNQCARMMANKELVLQRLHMTMNKKHSMIQNPTYKHMNQDTTNEQRIRMAWNKEIAHYRRIFAENQF
jgi:hypothetical protein